MRRIRITTNAKKHLEEVNRHRRNEVESARLALAFANSSLFSQETKLRTVQDFFGDAAESRRLARYHANLARKSLPPGYTKARRLVGKAKRAKKKAVKWLKS